MCRDCLRGARPGEFHAWTPLFYYKIQKGDVQHITNFLTYEQQIQKLQFEKQLIISDTFYAKTILSKLSYFSLINGYKNLFQHHPSGAYLHGVTLEEIVAFYYFDEELRTLFLKYILHIERHIKSVFSYYFCEKYGENQQSYLTASTYTLTNKNSADIHRLVTSLQKTISLPNHYDYITYHAATYGNVPLWVAVNALTFGQVSKMYQYVPNDIQAKVCREFHYLSEKQLHQFITVIARCRNVCAHSERLYSFHIRETIPDMPLHEKLQIPRKNGQYTMGKQDLFAIVLALYYFVDNKEFEQFQISLISLIRNVLTQCPHITKQQLLHEMGFPIVQSLPFS